MGNAEFQELMNSIHQMDALLLVEQMKNLDNIVFEETDNDIRI